MADEVVKLTLPEMVERFAYLGDKIAPTVYSAMLVAAQQMVRDVVRNRMSNPRRGSTATNLGVDTGTARRSMVGPATLEGNLVSAILGSSVEYVKAHEEGFHGIQHVRAHTRKIRALKRNAKTGLVSKKSAREYKAALRRGGKTTAFVSAHGRKVDIIAKHFIRDTVLAAKVPTENRILRALQIAAKTGRVPTPGQINAGA